MKLKILIAGMFLMFLMLSCSKNKKNYFRKNDIFKLKEYVISYKPNKINSFDDDSLKKYNIKYIFNLKEEDLKNEIANILLLKQYLLHLKKANQSYNLKDFNTKEAKIIIDYFLAENMINSNVEFLSSSIPYEFLKSKKCSKNVQMLIDSIKKEEDRINDL